MRRGTVLGEIKTVVRSSLLPLMLVVLLAQVGCNGTASVEDPLPSWNDGPTRSAIIQFVQNVTEEGGPKFVAPEKRIATFDNDGTLWCEQPVVQLEFAAHRIEAMAADHPEWADQEPYRAVLAGDKQYLVDDLLSGGHAILDVIAASHTGISKDEFRGYVAEFFAISEHPDYKVPYTKIVYTPMVELLVYLRANGFKTYICSGGGIDFMRGISEEVYGIVPENVIGSNGGSSFEQVDGRWVLIKSMDHAFKNDKLTKPVGIDLHIGRTPIFAAGNVRSGGDIGMLTYCNGNDLPSLQILVNHDDGEREYAYAEKDNASLNAAKAQGWKVVSMKTDWKTIFSFTDPPVIP